MVDVEPSVAAVRPPRDPAIDVAKGLGMVVIVMGHIDYTAVGAGLGSYLYTFNVAFFFLVSGYSTGSARRPVGAVLARAFRRVYLPYLALFAVSLLYGHVILRYVFGEFVVPFDARATLLSVLLASDRLNSVPTFNFALWFLPVFFIASVMFGAVRAIPFRAARVGVLAVCLLGSIPLQDLLPGRPPLNINVVPVALALMALGALLRRLRLGERVGPLLTVVLLASTIAVALWLPSNIGAIRTLLFYPAAVAAFLVLMRIATDLRSSRALAFLGRESLLVLGLHGLVANTYRFTPLDDLLATTWPGAMSYAVALLYVLLGTAAVVVLWRRVRGAVDAGRLRRRAGSPLDGDAAPAATGARPYDERTTAASRHDGAAER